MEHGETVENCGKLLRTEGPKYPGHLLDSPVSSLPFREKMGNQILSDKCNLYRLVC